MSQILQLGIHEIVVEALQILFIEFKTQYMVLQDSYNTDENSLFLRLRIQKEVRKFIEDPTFREGLINIYKENKPSFGDFDQKLIDKLDQRESDITDIFLTILLQDSISFLVQHYKYL